ncbi:MAG: hypothetical protein H6738_03570 [Alphaproteobacteria bacterium]|nr:hypothetical protein [Alphaproteobacteria bacterium]MCB9695847.1 hypothetical protein [Alphaproteobacteria bacterium]
MRRVALPLLSLLALSACGHDYCGRAEQMAKDCPDYFQYDDSCPEWTAECTSADQKLLDSWLDCLVDAGAMECPSGEPSTSTSGSTTDDGSAYLACATELIGISDACAGGVMGGGGTTSSSSYTMR